MFFNEKSPYQALMKHFMLENNIYFFVAIKKSIAKTINHVNMLILSASFIILA
jgi:hypothetical protein